MNEKELVGAAFAAELKYLKELGDLNRIEMIEQMHPELVAKEHKRIIATLRFDAASGCKNFSLFERPEWFNFSLEVYDTWIANLPEIWTLDVNNDGTHAKVHF